MDPTLGGYMHQYQSINPLLLPFVPTYIAPISGFGQSINDSDTNIINVGSGSIGGNPSPVTVTQVTTTTYTALSTDYFLCVDTFTHSTTITLPVGILGTVYIIKDCSGNSATNPITIQGTGGQLVDNSASAVINTNFGGIEVIFNGTEWSIV